jgi:hypothetical protein
LNDMTTDNLIGNGAAFVDAFHRRRFETGERR